MCHSKDIQWTYFENWSKIISFPDKKHRYLIVSSMVGFTGAGFLSNLFQNNSHSLCNRLDGRDGIRCKTDLWNLECFRQWVGTRCTGCEGNVQGEGGDAVEFHFYHSNLWSTSRLLWKMIDCTSFLENKTANQFVADYSPLISICTLNSNVMVFAKIFLYSLAALKKKVFVAIQFRIRAVYSQYCHANVREMMVLH